MVTSGSEPARGPIDVLIVGAGPVGLAAAVTLRRRGASVRIVDAAPQGATTSRAAVIHARTLEVLESIDMAATLVGEGVVVPDFTVRDGARTLARLDFRGLRTPYPYTLMLSQARTEELLHAALAELGGEVEREVELDTFMRANSGGDGGEGGAGVAGGAGEVAVLRHPDGTHEQVAARFVIGADGSRSRVRQERGIAFDGSEYAASFVLADVVLRWSLPADEVQLFLATRGLVVVAPLPGGRHRIVATMDEAPAQPTVADVQHILDERGPGGAVVDSLVWGSRFRVAHRLAATYRDGAVFLAGDAAHVHSPAGGQGMNLGIQDAVLLGGLLADVLGGGRGADALAQYERLRRPAARRVIALTDRMTRMATLRGPILRGLRDGAIRAVLHSRRRRTALARRIAQLDA
ncbi:FAD-dependent monooxygenase [Cnuibacter physcomitrellae]|uniref:FAD-dependent oxidoreductase n=1 Tax=Cnuibacter physcomitrellae TaxID=1619308 RepID=UPI002175B704|nr:FAD-dependent oxidoreductase [Cnuibacter physcomitrellae]MCS5497440.1 FAD-dependent monooxygenase [Cnuibacter physcomitrellae]